MKNRIDLILEENRPHWLKMAKSRYSDVDDAEDLTQEVSVKVWRFIENTL